MSYSVSGTSRMVVPVSNSTPNSAAPISSGVAIQTVSPSDSGPPMANPMKPPARWRSAGPEGEPDHRCHRPRTGSATIAEPRTSRGRAWWWGSVRISTSATAAISNGNRTTVAPTKVRRPESIQAPTGRAASNQDAAAMITARASSPRAIPSRRCPGSISRARPIERAVDPAPRATMNQVARAARPPADVATANADGPFRAGAGAFRAAGLRRAGTGFAGWDLPFELVVRAPERAAVLFAMRED